MERPDPATHKCDLPTLDYSKVQAGRITCDVARGGCGRVWVLIDLGGRSIWDPRPAPIRALLGRRSA